MARRSSSIPGIRQLIASGEDTYVVNTKKEWQKVARTSSGQGQGLARAALSDENYRLAYVTKEDS